MSENNTGENADILLSVSQHNWGFQRPRQVFDLLMEISPYSKLPQIPAFKAPVEGVPFDESLYAVCVVFIPAFVAFYLWNSYF